ncbi:hypothetical protein FACS1894208_01000 [Clostridia bacterium]|nr:hypothetical protein FACS1894208_01000 [Clostridia bacterium]
MGNLLRDKRVLIGLGIFIVVLLAAALVLLVPKGGGTVEPEEPGGVTDNGYSPDEGEYVETISATEWRNAVLVSPLIVDIEHLGVSYEVHIYEGVKYLYNTETKELVSGRSSGDALGTVLRDWIVPLEAESLDTADVLFEGCWANVGTRLRGLIGFCDETYELVTRARTADYLEYVYKDKDGIRYRVAATDNYILYAPLHFEYLFDADSY